MERLTDSGLEIRTGRTFRHLICHNKFLRDIINRRIEGKRDRERPKQSFIDGLKEKVDVESFKIRALNRADLRSFHGLYSIHSSNMSCASPFVLPSCDYVSPLGLDSNTFFAFPVTQLL